MADDRRRVIVIDDDEVVLVAITELLEAAGCKVFTLTSPIGATQVIVRESIDAAVIDVNLPVMQGDNVIRLFRSWDKVKDLITRRADPTAVAAAIRERLHTKYNSDEIKLSWLTLIEADPMAFIRTFCQLPYLSDGKTDSIARPVLEAYVVRLTHEKYASTYTKVLNSLRNTFRVKADSPTLLNFVSLAKWADADCGAKIAADIGMT